MEKKKEGIRKHTFVFFLIACLGVLTEYITLSRFSFQVPFWEAFGISSFANSAICIILTMYYLGKKYEEKKGVKK